MDDYQNPFLELYTTRLDAFCTLYIHFMFLFANHPPHMCLSFLQVLGDLRVRLVHARSQVVSRQASGAGVVTRQASGPTTACCVQRPMPLVREAATSGAR